MALKWLSIWPTSPLLSLPCLKSRLAARSMFVGGSIAALKGFDIRIDLNTKQRYLNPRVENSGFTLLHRAWDGCPPPVVRLPEQRILNRVVSGLFSLRYALRTKPDTPETRTAGCGGNQCVRLKYPYAQNRQSTDVLWHCSHPAFGLRRQAL